MLLKYMFWHSQSVYVVCNEAEGIGPYLFGKQHRFPNAVASLPQQHIMVHPGKLHFMIPGDNINEQPTETLLSTFESLTKIEDPKLDPSGAIPHDSSLCDASIPVFKFGKPLAVMEQCASEVYVLVLSKYVCCM